MPDLEKLVAFLKEQLTNFDPSPPSIENWLARVNESEQSIQLAACIGIDLLLKSIPPRVVSELISRAEVLAASHAGSSACQLFQLALNEYPQDKLLCNSPMNGFGTFMGEYVRVLDLLDFVTYYTPLKPLSPASKVKARKQFPDGTRLGSVRNCWRGRLAIVWVTSREQLVNILEDPSKTDAKAQVAKRFGLNKPTDTLGEIPEYSEVRYPGNFGVACAKPSVFDQVWDVEHRYVSFHGKPYWGQTLASPSNETGVDEQVHPSMAGGLTDAFTLWHIGPCKAPGTNEDVAPAALERFVAMLTSAKEK